MKIKILHLIFLITIKNTFQSIKFSFIVDIRKSTCFTEQFSQYTPTKINASSDNGQGRYRIIDPKGITLFNKENQKTVTININPTVSGSYQICFDNFTKEVILFNFEYIYGVAAKDYSSLVTSEKIKPLELYLIKLYDSFEYISNEFSVMMKKEIEYYSYHTEILSSKIMTLSVFVLIVSLFINGLEIVFLNKYLLKRKTI
jgi:hypothetical protein